MMFNIEHHSITGTKKTDLMELSENTFKVLDTLDNHVITTQRQLSKHAGVSLGQVNYVLKNLLEKGWVKLGNFKKNPRKISYAYLLTPSGMEAKSSIAVRFVVSKLREYHRLRESMVKKLSEIQSKGLRRIVFLGPMIIHDLLKSVIQEQDLNINLLASFQTLKELEDFPIDAYDVVVLGNGDRSGLKQLTKKVGKNRIIHLW